MIHCVRLFSLTVAIFSLITLPFFNSRVYGVEQSVQYRDPTGPITECVQYKGYRRIGVDRYALRFFNSCPDKMQVNVCLRNDDGTIKLYRSARRIPVAGNFEIYTLPGDRPVSLNMTFNRYMPAIPPPCTEEDAE